MNITEMVDVVDSVNHYLITSRHGKTLEYLMQNKDRWLHVRDICMHTRAKNATSTGVIIRILQCDYKIERKVINHDVMYRFVGNVPITKQYYDVLKVMDEHACSWISSRHVSRILDMPIQEVGEILRYFVSVLGIQRCTGRRGKSYYRYMNYDAIR